MKNRLFKEQKGFSLPMALVILAVGAFVVVPFIIGMSVTLLSSRNSQVSTHEQYALDGAYEDVVWDLKYGTLADSLAEPCDSISYELTEEVNGLYPSVSVTRTDDCGGDDGLDSKTYQIYVSSGTSSLTREFVDDTVFVAAVPQSSPTPGTGGALVPTPGSGPTSVPISSTDPTAVPTAVPTICAVPTPTPAPTPTPVPEQLTPRELKERVVANLSPYEDNSGKYGERFKKTVEETEKSLDPKIWATKPGNSGNNNIDPYRLDLKEGKKGFDHDAKAIKELKELLKGFPDDKCGGVTSIALEYTGRGIVAVDVYLENTLLGSFIVEAEDPESTSDSIYASTFEITATEATDGKLDDEIRLVIDGREVAKFHTSCSKSIEIGDRDGDFTIDDLEKLPSDDQDRLQVTEESREFARMAVEDLLEADRMLAQLFWDENKDLVANNPDNQEKVDKELHKAAKELALAEIERTWEADSPDKAIKRYKKAWEHTMHAVNEAAKD